MKPSLDGAIQSLFAEHTRELEDRIKILENKNKTLEHELARRPSAPNADEPWTETETKNVAYKLHTFATQAASFHGRRVLEMKRKFHEVLATEI